MVRITKATAFAVALGCLAASLQGCSLTLSSTSTNPTTESARKQQIEDGKKPKKEDLKYEDVNDAKSLVEEAKTKEKEAKELEAEKKELEDKQKKDKEDDKDDKHSKNSSAITQMNSTSAVADGEDKTTIKKRLRTLTEDIAEAKAAAAKYYAKAQEDLGVGLTTRGTTHLLEEKQFGHFDLMLAGSVGFALGLFVAAAVAWSARPRKLERPGDVAAPLLA